MKYLKKRIIFLLLNKGLSDTFAIAIAVAGYSGALGAGAQCFPMCEED